MYPDRMRPGIAPPKSAMANDRVKKVL